MKQTLIPASDSLLVLLDPEVMYNGKLPVSLVDLTGGEWRVHVSGSHRWTSFERDFPTQAEASAAYDLLTKEPRITRATLARHGLRQS